MKSSGRRLLSSKEKKAFVKEAFLALNIDLTEFYREKPVIEHMNLQKNTEVFLINGIPFLIKKGGDLFLTLRADALLNLLPRVIINMGAIPHICNNADVMSPGIVSVLGNFGSGAIVAIADEKHGKFIAVGKALVGSEELKSIKSGKVVKNMHFIGDELWEFFKNLH